MEGKIFLVAVVDANDLDIYKPKAFCKREDAENYFKDILAKDFNMTDEESVFECVEEGYYKDTTHYAVSISSVNVS